MAFCICCIEFDSLRSPSLSKYNNVVHCYTGLAVRYTQGFRYCYIVMKIGLNVTGCITIGHRPKC